MADWRPGHPINFNPTGDMTSQAIFKHIQELSKVYEHLNYLRSNVEGGTSLAITGVVPNKESLPATERIGAIYLAAGTLYAWDGEHWVEIGTPTMPHATTNTPGIVQLGTLASLSSGTPSTLRVVTEAMLEQYRQSSDRIPSGTVVMWYGAANAIPPGWVLCDGNNKTPNLLGRFPVGVANVSQAPGGTGGSNTTTLKMENMPQHAHEFRGTAMQVNIEGHSHGIHITSSGQSENHEHILEGFTDEDGAHAHKPAQDWKTFYVGEKNPVINWVADNSGSKIVGGPSPASGMFSGDTTNAVPHQHHFRTTTVGVTKDHNHSVSGATDTAGSGTANVTATGQISNAGAGAAFDHRPAYCELVFIMKM